MEKRDEILYVRVRPETKKYLETRAKKEGFKVFSDWFEQWIRKIKTRDSNKK